MQDYEVYYRSVAGVDAMWKSGETDGFHITNWAMHPVTMVNWNDAKAFCQWLTEQERAEGLLATNQTYRLPTNEEWSKAMGLPDDVATKNIYPWGKSWPPPPAFGNYADSTLTNYSPNLDFIEGYDDGFATTSPVGSFKANVNGLFDMSGNVWQWCEDEYVNLIPGRVLRGGAWNTNDRESLAGAYRGSFLPNSRNTVS